MDQEQHEGFEERFLPLAIVSILVPYLSWLIPQAHGHSNEALIVRLCLLGAVALVVQVCQSTMVLHPLRPWVQRAVTYAAENASRFVASLVIVVITLRVWNGEELHRNQRYGAGHASSVLMLAVGFFLAYITPLLGGLLQPVALVPPAGHRKFWAKIKKFAPRNKFLAKIKEFGSTTAVYGLSVAIAVIGGGGIVLVALGLVSATTALFQEPATWNVIRAFQRRNEPGGRLALQDEIARLQKEISWTGASEFFRRIPMRVARSPVVLPTLLLWLVYGTLCSWRSKESVRMLTLVFKVMEIAVCFMHLLWAPVDRGDVPAGNAAWYTKALVCVCSPMAWTLFLLCARILDQTSWEGVLVVYAVSFVAIRTPHKRAWRGLMLVFWVALFWTVAHAKAAALMQTSQFYSIVVGARGFRGFLRAAGALRKEIIAASWSTCPN